MLNVFWTYVASKREIKQFNCQKSSAFKWLWTPAKCDPMALKELFSKKLQKIAQRLGAGPPVPQSLQRLGAPSPDPMCDTFELHKLSQHVSNVRYLRFSSLIPLSLQNPRYLPTGNDFRPFYLRYLCPTKTFCLEKFWWRHCLWFVI